MTTSLVAVALQRKGEGGSKSSKKAKGSPQQPAPERPPGGKLYFLLKRRVSELLLCKSVACIWSDACRAWPPQ